MAKFLEDSKFFWTEYHSGKVNVVLHLVRSEAEMKKNDSELRLKSKLEFQLRTTVAVEV
jgi:hypothetical protein